MKKLSSRINGLWCAQRGIRKCVPLIPNAGKLLIAVRPFIDIQVAPVSRYALHYPYGISRCRIGRGGEAVIDYIRLGRVHPCRVKEYIVEALRVMYRGKHLQYIIQYDGLRVGRAYHIVM